MFIILRFWRPSPENMEGHTASQVDKMDFDRPLVCLWIRQLYVFRSAFSGSDPTVVTYEAILLWIYPILDN